MRQIWCLNPLQEVGEREPNCRCLPRLWRVLIPFRKSGRENRTAVAFRDSGGS